MRKLIGRAIATTVLAAIAVVPLAGMAQAAPESPAAVSWGRHHHRCHDECDRGCDDECGRGDFDVFGGLFGIGSLDLF